MYKHVHTRLNQVHTRLNIIVYIPCSYMYIWNPDNLPYTVIWRHIPSFDGHMTPYPMLCHMGSYDRHMTPYTFWKSIWRYMTVICRHIFFRSGTVYGGIWLSYDSICTKKIPRIFCIFMHSPLCWLLLSAVKQNPTCLREAKPRAGQAAGSERDSSTLGVLGSKGSQLSNSRTATPIQQLLPVAYCKY